MFTMDLAQVLEAKLSLEIHCNSSCAQVLAFLAGRVGKLKPSSVITMLTALLQFQTTCSNIYNVHSYIAAIVALD